MSIQKKNLQVAEQLNLLADLESLAGNVWPARAYNKAASTVLSLDIPIDTVNDLKSLSGVGDSIADKMMEILKTGTCQKLEALKAANTDGVASRILLGVPGVGMKTALKLYKKGYTTVQLLSDACDAGKVTAKSIKAGVKLALKTQGRIPIYDVLPIVEPILEDLRWMPGVRAASFAGSVRRGKETIKDVDIVIVASDREAVIDRFLEYGEELVRGDQKARIIIPINHRTSVTMDLLFTTAESWGPAMAYFTGSKEHNISLRRRALERGMTLNEHSLTRISDGLNMLPSRFDDMYTEDDIYTQLGLPWCPPELREGSDLLEKIPDLVTEDDIVSDWHMHTTYSSDAKNSVMEMAIAAKEKGLTSIGITDHVEVQYKWMPEDIEKRILEIRKAEKHTGIKIYAGAEVGVNVDGTLVNRIDIEKQEYIIVSIHKSHSKEPVKRLIKAMEHPKVKFIGHPTGRLLGRRDVPDDDWDKLFKACVENNVALEINGPRLDLPVYLIRRAKTIGCKFVLNSDAHAVEHLLWQRYALSLARRAGLTVNDLVTPFAS